MKYVIYGLIGVLICAASIVAIMAINTKGTRENELQDALESSIEESLYARAYMEELTDDNLKEDFTNRFLSKIQAGEGYFDKNLGVEINFLAADARAGILSVEVTESYSKLFSNIGSNHATATAVVDFEEPAYDDLDVA